MAGWYRTGTMRRSTKMVIAAALLAVVLVAAVPVALVAGLILMLFGHVVAGFALFGASILAAIAAVVIASLSGVRHVRSLIAQHGYRAVRLAPSEYHYD